MSNVFIKRIEISNYRCFENEGIDFSVPDGITPGSGLNVLIGENGNGKTTILEAINYLTQSSYASENKLKINDFRDHNKEINIKAYTDDYRCKMSLPYRGYFECDGFEFKAKSRDRKSAGKLLSSPFQINSYFLNKFDNYRKETGEDSGKEIPALYKIYSNSKIDGGEINIFFFDKNRTRQITTGNYKTTFERICDDLNWKFVKNIDEDNIEKLIDNICGEYFRTVLNVTQKGTGDKLSSDLKEFFDDDLYENLKIELLDLLSPFSNAFFAIRKEKELNQIKTKDLGSGIEIILTLLLLKNIAGESKGSITYLIDEPELHLHPKAQEKLIELLIHESATKQVIVSTHSPYLFKNCLAHDIGLQILAKDENNKINITQAKNRGWGIFPWSPSWGEINYFAYDLPTVEFHNELYGYLQEKKQKYTLSDLEEHLSSKTINKTKQWIQVKNGNPQAPYDVTLCTYIRNTIHHPENTQNNPFTNDELKESIEILMKII